MDLAAVPGRDKEIAAAVKGKRPDVLRLGIVEGFELAIGFDSKNFPVGAVAAYTRSRLSTAIA